MRRALRIARARYWNNLHHMPKIPDRIPQHPVHELVTGPFRGVALVKENHGTLPNPEVCEVAQWVDGKSIRTGYHETHLKKITLLRFMWYRHPETGRPQIGYNEGIAFIIGMPIATAMALAVGALGSDVEWGYWIIYGIFAAVPLAFFGGAVAQYYGWRLKWFR